MYALDDHLDTGQAPRSTAGICCDTSFQRNQGQPGCAVLWGLQEPATTGAGQSVGFEVAEGPQGKPCAKGRRKP
jgi:hypothetical protein